MKTFKKAFDKLNSLSIAKLLIVIVVVGLFAYGNMLGNSFVWDDEEMVVKNFPIFEIKNIPLLFEQATFFSGGSALSGWFYRPLVMVSFLMIKVFLGQSAVGYHLVQLIFHLANAGLVFLIFENLFVEKNKDLSRLLSFLAAIIFVVHPAHVEAVSYIASLAEPLYTFFLLSIFLMVLKVKEKEFGERKLFIIFLLFLLATLAKEGVLVFLPIMAIYLYFYQKKHLGKVLLTLILSIVAYLFIRLSFFGLQTQRPEFLSPIAQATWGQRLLTAPFVFVSFLKAFFYPKILSISQHTVVKNINETSFWLPLVISAAFISLVLLFIAKTKDKLLIFFSAWFFVSVLPVLNIVMPLDMTFAERWLYFPMIGLLGMVFSLILNFVKKKKHLMLIPSVFLFVTLLLSLRTIDRNRDWKDGLTLYSHDIKIQPESFDLQNNLGVELFRKKEFERALSHFKKSVEFQPNWSISLNNLGAVYQRMGDNEKAYEFYKKASEKSDYYLAYENLAYLIYSTKGAKEALPFLEKAVAKFPNNPRINFLIASAYYQIGNKKEAFIFAQKAYLLNPSLEAKRLIEIISSSKSLDFSE